MHVGAPAFAFRYENAVMDNRARVLMKMFALSL